MGYNKLFTNVLRSRCRHTKQKDTGLAAFTQKSKLYDEYVTAKSFLKEVVSLREVNEFHEFCAEKLYSTVKNKTSADYEFCIMLLYSRRGSLDINPVRASLYDMLPQALIDVNILTEKVQGQ